MPKTAMDYDLVYFQPLCEVNLETGEFDVVTIERLLNQGKVNNFAGSYFSGAKGTRLTLTKRSATVVLVEVYSRMTCYLDAGFLAKAYSSGLTHLDLAAGPFLALAKGNDFTPVTVITRPIVIGSTTRFNREEFFWKIIKPAPGNVTLAVINSRERVEGKKIYAFAKVSNST